MPETDLPEGRQHRRPSCRGSMNGDHHIPFPAMNETSPFPTQQDGDDNHQHGEWHRAQKRAQRRHRAHGQAGDEPLGEIVAQTRTQIGACAGAVSLLVVLAASDWPFAAAALVRQPVDRVATPPNLRMRPRNSSIACCNRSRPKSGQ